jgi:hypothetical protein
VLAGGGAAAAVVVMSRMQHDETPPATKPIAVPPADAAIAIDAAPQRPDAAAIVAASPVDAAEPVAIDAAVVADEPEPEPPPPDEPPPDRNTFGGAFKAARPELVACIATPGTTGTARVRIGADGRVGNAVIKGFSPREAACLGDVVRSLRFARKANAPSFTVTVTIPPDARAPRR